MAVEYVDKRMRPLRSQPAQIKGLVARALRSDGELYHAATAPDNENVSDQIHISF